jgi:hypothetical protein
MEDAAARRQRHKAAPGKERDAPQGGRRRALELDLARVKAELAECRNERFRAQLEAELRYLEGQLGKQEG